MARREKRSEPSAGAPTWIVSFSDMVTLLLAFFVLLQSFAHVQDPDLFFVGQGSFRRAIAGLGIPSWLFGREDKLRQEHIKVKHSMEEGPPVTPQPRVIDADGEKIRRMFADLQEQLEMTAADLSEEPIRVEPTTIRFEKSQADLGDEAKAYLRQLAFEVRQTVGAASLRFYVIGLAADAPEASQQWSVSARRAHAVEEYLGELLRGEAAGGGWSISSWGAGAGDAWCRKHGCIPGRTSIVIAIFAERNGNG